MPRSKREIAKSVVGFIVGYGAQRIAKNIVDKNTDEEERLHNRAVVYSGTVVIGFMAADAARAYTDKSIDQFCDWWETEVKPKL
jgi:hypothetical protein